MSFDDDMKEALKTFTLESFELLQDMEDCLLGLEECDDSEEKINAIFRAAHTIKGSAGLFGLDHIVKFTHVVESVLDLLRSGKLIVSSELVAALLPCCDYMNMLIQAVADGSMEDDLEMSAAGQELLAGLQPFLDGTQDKPVTPVAEKKPEFESSGGGIVESGNWHLSLRISADVLRGGMDPLSFIRYLSTLGEVVNLTTITEAIPPVEQMDPENNYLGFEIDLKSGATKEEIEEVFEFIQDGSTIRILPHDSMIDDFIMLIHELPEDDSFLGQLLVKSGVLTEHELEQALSQQASDKQKSEDAASQPAQPIGEILVEKQAVPQSVVNAALVKQKQIKENKTRENQSIRVDADRLDKLIDLIGELVISGAGVSLRASLSDDEFLQEATGNVLRLVEEVRDTALQLRMVPIGTTFSRFQRVVRDVSKELGKDIQLRINGGDTEVDKSVVEKIGDPLMHLVRNSMDHGIESADIRLKRGKPERGLLQLNAYHDSGTIVIEVKDDGGGLDRERILAKAIENGLVSADIVLSDQEVYALIFEPGFSTAKQVSNLSGRGVGMDVVKRNVSALRGTIEIDSHLGEGTTIRIRLPLTLAIIDGFLVAVGDSSFIFPLDRVVECVELPVGFNSVDYMDLRGEVLPFIRLRTLFNIDAGAVKRENVVVVQFAGVKVGFIVDRLLGEFQTVIKPLGKLFSHVKGLAGSTILGNGRVALILDVPTLVNYVDRKNLALYQDKKTYLA